MDEDEIDDDDVDNITQEEEEDDEESESNGRFLSISISLQSLNFLLHVSTNNLVFPWFLKDTHHECIRSLAKMSPPVV